MCNKHESGHEPDELQARFTVYMEKVVVHARINYMKKLRRLREDLSLDDLVCEPSVDFDSIYSDSVAKVDFEFEEERIAEAFHSLPLMRQKVLQLIFIENMEPPEIARRLNCSTKYVYDQQYLALQRLRNLLGGDNVQK